MTPRGGGFRGFKRSLSLSAGKHVVLRRSESSSTGLIADRQSKVTFLVGKAASGSAASATKGFDVYSHYRQLVVELLSGDSTQKSVNSSRGPADDLKLISTGQSQATDDTTTAGVALNSTATDCGGHKSNTTTSLGSGSSGVGSSLSSSQQKRHIRRQTQPSPILSALGATATTTTSFGVAALGSACGIHTPTSTKEAVAIDSNSSDKGVLATEASESNGSISPCSSMPNQTEPLTPVHEERVLVVGKGVVLTADVTSCDKVVVEGRFKGNITTGTFVLAEGGHMEGEVRCGDGRIGGKMQAIIVASNTLMIGSAAVVTGDVVYENLEIIDGGRLQGKLTHFSSTQSSTPTTTDESSASTKTS